MASSDPTDPHSLANTPANGSNPNDLDALTRFDDPAYQQFSAEFAFDGVCSIAVADILFRARDSVVNGNARPIRNVVDGWFLSPPTLPPANKPVRWKFWKNTPNEVAPAILAPDGFYPLVETRVFGSTGLDIQVGFHSNTLGLYVLDGDFIPLVRFVDQSHYNRQCSFADLDPRSLGLDPNNLVVTTKDETRSLIAEKSLTDLSFHVVADVLQLIEDAFQIDHEIPLETRIEKLDNIFHFDDVVKNVLRLNSDIDYSEEFQIRSRVDLLRKTTPIGVATFLAKRDYPNDKNPSATSIRESSIVFDKDGGFIIRETLHYPLATNRDQGDFTTIFFNAEFGMVYSVGNGLKSQDYATAIGYTNLILSHDSASVSDGGIDTDAQRLESILNQRRRLSSERGLNDRAIDWIENAMVQLMGDEFKDEPNTLKRFVAFFQATTELTYKDQALHDRYRTFNDFLQATTGIDTERAWEIREMLWQDVNLKPEVIASLAGIDSDRAWEMRDQYLQSLRDSEQKLNFSSLAPLFDSVTGIDTNRAWEVRGLIGSVEFLKYDHVASRASIAYATSLVGLDNEHSWQAIDFLLRETATFLYPGEVSSQINESIAGQDGGRFQELRKKEFEYFNRMRKEGYTSSLIDNWNIGTGLSGIDTKESWKWRKLLRVEGQLYSIAGMDSERAWDIRSRAMASLKRHDYDPDLQHAFLASLSGLVGIKAEEVKGEFLQWRNSLGADPVETSSLIARSYTGGPLGVGLRTAQIARENVKMSPTPALATLGQLSR